MSTERKRQIAYIQNLDTAEKAVLDSLILGVPASSLLGEKDCIPFIMFGFLHRKGVNIPAASYLDALVKVNAGSITGPALRVLAPILK